MKTALSVLPPVLRKWEEEEEEDVQKEEEDVQQVDEEDEVRGQFDEEEPGEYGMVQWSYLSL